MIQAALLPLALLVASYYALSMEEKKRVMSPEQAKAFSEMRPLRGGGTARYYKTELVSGLLRMLAEKSLEPVNGATDGAGLLIFRLVDAKPGSASGREAVTQANQGGFVVFGSLTLAAVASPGLERFVMFAKPDRRVKASEQSQWAILLDAEPGAYATPPAGSTPYDAKMGAELVREVSTALADDSLEPAMLEEMAKELEGRHYPVAAKALRDRASVLRLRAASGDKKTGGVPYLVRKGPGGVATDLPYFLASYYTGDGSRLREIVSVNPGMTMGKSGPVPWKAGMTVLLPLSWNVRSKPIPPPLKMGVPPKPKPAPAPAPGVGPDEAAAYNAWRDAQLAQGQQAGPPPPPASGPRDPVAEALAAQEEAKRRQEAATRAAEDAKWKADQAKAEAEARVEQAEAQQEQIEKQLG